MSKYNDKELNRLLSDSDELLADLNLHLYESPEEEKARLAEEEAKRQEAERQRQEAEERERAEAEAERQRQENEEREQAEAEAERQRQEAEEREQAEAEAETERQRQEAEERERAEAEAERQRQEAEAETEAEVEPEAEHQRPEAERNSSFLFSVVFVMLSFMYMETMTHIGVYKSVGTEFIYPLFFSASLACVICLLTGFLNVRGNTMLAAGFQILFALYCDLQLVYHAAMGNFLRLSQARNDLWLLKNSGQAGMACQSVLPWMILMFLPVIFWAVLGRKKLEFSRTHWLTKLVLVIGMVVFAVIGVMLLDVQGYEEYTPYAAFYHYDTEEKAEQAGNQLGMIGLTALEVMSLLTNLE
jgi:hypothetical protein